MAPHKKKSILFGHSHSGKKTGKKSKTHNKKQAKATANENPVWESPDFASKFEHPFMLPSPEGSESDEKEDIHYDSSRPGSETETLSSATQLPHARKRSHSLPSQSVSGRTLGELDAHNARTQATSLIRSRALSRCSESDQLSPEILQILLRNIPTCEEDLDSAPEGPPDSMADFMKASLMDFVKKPKKNKKRKKKGGNAEASQIPVEQAGEPSRAPEKDNTDHVPVAQTKEISKASQKENTDLIPIEQAGETSNAPQQENNDLVPVEQTDEPSKVPQKEKTDHVPIQQAKASESSEANKKDNTDHVPIEDTGESSKAPEKDNTDHVPVEQTDETSEPSKNDNTDPVPVELTGASSGSSQKISTDHAPINEAARFSKAPENENIENNVPTEQNGESSKTPFLASTIELPIREKDTSIKSGSVAEEQSISTQPSDDTDKDKGKQRVAGLDEGSHEAASPDSSQPSDDSDKEKGKQRAEELDEVSNKGAALSSAQSLDENDSFLGKQRVESLEDEDEDEAAALHSRISYSPPSPTDSSVSWTNIVDPPKTSGLERTEDSSTAPVDKESYTDKLKTEEPKMPEVPGTKINNSALPAQQVSDTGNAISEVPKTPEPTGSKGQLLQGLSLNISGTKHTDIASYLGSRPFIVSSQSNSAKPGSSKKKQLPAIHEGQAQHDIASPQYPFDVSSTPKSTGTASTSNVWTPNAPISTPQTDTAASAPSSSDSLQGKFKSKGKGKNKKNKGKGKATNPTEVAGSASAPGPAPASTPSPSTPSTNFTPGPLIVSSHAHPSPSTATSLSAGVPNNTIQRNGQQMVKQKPDDWWWNLDIECFDCQKEGCNKKCNLWDNVSKICPRCGPFSEVRYCSREHLLEDIKKHWETCGTYTFQHRCKVSTLPRDVLESPPLIPCLYAYDMPERHRQAVHFNMNHRHGDYFIFSDWRDMVKEKVSGRPDTDAVKTALRCSPDILHVVKFDDPEARDRLRRVLAAVLFTTIENPGLTDYLYRLIRDHIRATTDELTNPPRNPLLTLEKSLKYQMFREFAFTVQPYITGERHACPTEWAGRNRRSCTDDVCWKEYEEQYKLGQRNRGGHKMVVEELEASYWILRMSRITHSTVEKPIERMMGKGFKIEDGHYGVDERDQRKFCRGPGWDGFDAGEMQIEGINY
ncbi:hypothetical protein BDW74DRAFT_174886 [Aspergillus multicolor]|uniref:uncharacterized protein n=1 Tax=Aspergillus multicolor TaxID=41759 RepID=UPI003CCCFF08